MKVIMCGSRFWDDRSIIRAVLSQLPQDAIIVHGACKGADMIVDALARSQGFDVRPYPAKWDEYGVQAGPIRNRQMVVQEGPIDLVIAFHENIEDSRGTKDMLDVADIGQIPWELHTASGYTYGSWAY